VCILVIYVYVIHMHTDIHIHAYVCVCEFVHDGGVYTGNISLHQQRPDYALARYVCMSVSVVMSRYRCLILRIVRVPHLSPENTARG
jgi:hypothetical protein